MPKRPIDGERECVKSFCPECWPPTECRRAGEQIAALEMAANLHDQIEESDARLLAATEAAATRAMAEVSRLASEAVERDARIVTLERDLTETNRLWHEAVAQAEELRAEIRKISLLVLEGRLEDAYAVARAALSKTEAR